MASLLSTWTSTYLNHCCRTNEACSSTQTMLSFYSFHFRQRCNVKLCFQLSRAISGSGVLNPAARERSRNMGNCLKSDLSYINDLEEQLHELFNEAEISTRVVREAGARIELQANESKMEMAFQNKTEEKRL
nr:nephrocystin-3 isoform X1 [Ipomoea batatas]